MTTQLESQNSFAQFFFIVVPDLDNYKYRLFRVLHPLQFYPLEIQAEVIGKSFQCATEKEFEDALREVFNSDQTKKIIRAILAQVEEPAQS